ncbi:FIGNL1-interacting regulator of recombination and mitosis-like [Oratosquilla oratoria]|uniref:FIGNL1-interacting regulator of recombination and mitosis-like n=1 Tax=Oratosquilla oratoria TaxID=337810 RepID=UPI003F773BBB
MQYVLSLFDRGLADVESISDGSSNIKNVNELLELITLLLDTCEVAVEYTGQFEKLEVDKIPQLPQAVVHVVKGTLNHCKGSDIIYGKSLEAVNQSLTELFQHAVQLNNGFVGLLNRLTFNSFENEDMALLADVCEGLSSIASNLSRLSEMKSMVTTWKTFTSLTHRYHSDLATHIDLGQTVKDLVTEVTEGLSYFDSFRENLDEGHLDEKVVQRIIKVTSFCLKIVVALCDKFKGYIRSVHSSLVSLLITLFKYAPYNLPKGINKNLKESMERQVTVAIEPLISHLIEDSQFIKAVQDVNDEVRIETSSEYLLLLASVMSHLISANNVAREMWATAKPHIFQLVFISLKECHIGLSIPVMLPGIMCQGKPQTDVSLYQHVLMRACGYVANSTPEEYSRIEQELAKGLLSDSSWVSLFASDVWCFVGRYGTSELCETHCLSLCELLEVLPDSCITQKRTIAMLLRRLIRMLDVDRKENIFQNLCKKSSPSLVHCFPEEMCEDVHLTPIWKNYSNSVSQGISKIVEGAATDETLKSMMTGMEMLYTFVLPSTTFATTNLEEFGEVVNSLCKLWRRLPIDTSVGTLEEELFQHLALLSSSVLDHFDNEDLLYILDVCRKAAEFGTLGTKCSVCHVIEALGGRFISDCSQQQEILQLITDTLVTLLQNEDAYVQQTALDAFVKFGQRTQHVEVLPKCVEQCRQDVEDKITQYLSEKPAPALAEACEAEVFRQQKTTFQNCTEPLFTPVVYKSKDDTQPEEKNLQDSQESSSPPNKKMKVTEAENEDSDRGLVKPLLQALRASQDALHTLCTSGVGLSDREREDIQSFLLALTNKWKEL